VQYSGYELSWELSSETQLMQMAILRPPVQPLASMVMSRSSILKMYGSNLGRNIDYPAWGLSLFYLVPSVFPNGPYIFIIHGLFKILFSS
jgi:hypothetical protein